LQTSRARNTLEIHGSLIVRSEGPYWHGFFHHARRRHSGTRLQSGLRANQAQLLEAECRAIELASAERQFGLLPEPHPWANESRKSSASPSPKSISVALAGRHTWDQLNLEANRLPLVAEARGSG